MVSYTGTGPGDLDQLLKRVQAENRDGSATHHGTVAGARVGMSRVVARRTALRIAEVPSHIDHGPGLDAHIFSYCRPSLEAVGKIEWLETLLSEKRFCNQESHLSIVGEFTRSPKAGIDHVPESRRVARANFAATHKFERGAECVSHRKSNEATSNPVVSS
jgi:hypothetical protein